MSERWRILAVLFFARLTMAFQFQSVAALSPMIAGAYGIDLADIGLLIGLYLAPGVIVAIPGGAIAARFGEKRIVALSMGLMLLGGALAALGDSWGALVAGRLLAGAGGVIINIVMTKMLVDWFVGREVATAMAIFVNSWPLGIALGLLCLPAAAAVGGLELARIVVLAAIALGLLLFWQVYRPAAGAAFGPTSLTLIRLPVTPLILAALIWALYNSALAMVFSFGPALLSDRGWSHGAAGSATSLFMIVLALSVPLGGVIADRTGRRDGVILVSLVSYAVLMPLIPYVPSWAVAAIFPVAGALFGLAAGPIMTLPSQVLPPAARRPHVRHGGVLCALLWRDDGRAGRRRGPCREHRKHRCGFPTGGGGVGGLRAGAVGVPPQLQSGPEMIRGPGRA